MDGEQEAQDDGESKPMEPLPGSEAKEDIGVEDQPGRSLDERKLDYVHSTPGTQPRSQSSVRILLFASLLCLIVRLTSGCLRLINLYPNSSHATELATTLPTAPNSCTLILPNVVVSTGHPANPHLLWAHVRAPMQSPLIGTS